MGCDRLLGGNDLGGLRLQLCELGGNPRELLNGVGRAHRHRQRIFGLDRHKLTARLLVGFDDLKLLVCGLAGICRFGHLGETVAPDPAAAGPSLQIPACENQALAVSTVT